MDHQAFYSTVATVIPIVIVAMFLEDRGGADLTRSQSLYRLLPLLVMFFGETTCFVALVQKPTTLDREIAEIAIGAGFIGLIGPPLQTLLSAVTRHTDALVYGVFVVWLVLALTVKANAMPVLTFALMIVIAVAGLVFTIKDALQKETDDGQSSSSEPEPPSAT